MIELLTYLHHSLLIDGVACSYLGESDYYHGHLSFRYEITDTNQQVIVAVVDDLKYSKSLRGIKLLVKHLDDITEGKNYYQTMMDIRIVQLQRELKEGYYEKFN
ncbi:hypothetical protein SAMN04488084_102708 [Pedobacter antarcticus]|nr:hypothetical protein SAMN04488084_102708 [Pedobacter antarcticus]